MNDALRLGIGGYMLPIPAFLWTRLVAKQAQGVAKSLTFMSADHHRVRNFVVTEIARTAAKLSPERISQELDLPAEEVKQILDKLERRMTFLFRNPQGEVTWAYPVTSEATPHTVELSTGEKVHSA